MKSTSYRKTLTDTEMETILIALEECLNSSRLVFNIAQADAAFDLKRELGGKLQNNQYHARVEAAQKAGKSQFDILMDEADRYIERKKLDAAESDDSATPVGFDE